MKKKLFSLLLLTLCLGGHTKTTYIPMYRSMIRIEQGNDTIFDTNKKISLELASGDGMFRVSVNHEDMTLEKIKEIKRSKAAAGWMGFAAVMSGVSTGMTRNPFLHTIRMYNAIAISELADIYTFNAEATQILGVEAAIDNTSSEEIIVSDMERGLTWYLKPHTSLYLPMLNPQLLELRVSDLFHKSVKYVTIGAGSTSKKIDIEWEDEEYWAFPLTDTDSSGYISTIGYCLLHKYDATTQQLSKDEFKKFKAARKK